MQHATEFIAVGVFSCLKMLVEEYTMPLQELLYKEWYETVLNEAMQYSMEFDHLYQQADKAMYESKRTEGTIATFYDDIK